MTNKLTCPSCDTYTSAAFRAYEDGRPCPQCGSSLSAASQQFYRQLPDDHRWPGALERECTAGGMTGYPTPFGEWADAHIEANAQAYDSILLGLGDVLRSAWFMLAASLCDCPGPHHRWNCTLTPTYAQTMRELDINPWLVFRPWELELANYSPPARDDGGSLWPAG